MVKTRGYIGVILLFLTVSCRHAEKNSRETVSADSLSVWLKDRINPLLVNLETKEVERVLDSVYPQMAKRPYPLLCRWLLFKAEQKIVENELDSARWYNKQALSLIPLKDGKRKEVLTAKIQLTEIFTYEQQWDSALAIAHQAHYLSQQLDTALLGLTNIRLFDIYAAIGELASARQYAFAAYRYSHNNAILKAIAVNAIARYYESVNEVDSAIGYFRNLLHDNKELHSLHYDAVVFENLGVLLNRKGKGREALPFLRRAYELNTTLNDVDGLSMYNLAVAYTQTGSYENSLRHLDSADRYARSANDLALLRKISYLRFADFRKTNRHEKAYKEVDSLYNTFNSVLESSVVQLAKELETKYGLKEREDKISELALANQVKSKISRQQRIIIVFLVISGLLAFGIAVLLYRRRKMRMHRRETELRLQLLRTQMETHFLFNTLSTLQALILGAETEKAMQYLLQLSKLLRAMLENASRPFVKLAEEIKALESYFFLQSLNTHIQFDYRINVPDSAANILIPPMLVQPFVENSILHGISNIDRKGRIDVDMQYKDGKLYCIIDDNGKGIDLAGGNRMRQSLAVSLVRERLHVLGRQTRQTTSLHIVDKKLNQEGPGVRVIIEIPIGDARQTPLSHEGGWSS